MDDDPFEPEVPSPASPADSPAHERTEPRVRPGSWSRLDTVVITVLTLNFAIMAALVLLPGGARAPTQAPTQKEAKPSRTTVSGTVGQPPAPPGSTVSGTGGRASLMVRSQKWEEARERASRGDVDGAIAALEALLQDSALSRIVRRSVYLQLSYYCGLDGRAEAARKWLRLSKIDLEVGLVPEELWRLAEDAFRARDFPEARRYVARFMLQEGQMSGELRQNLAVAYLRLADGYREEARGPASENEAGEGR